MHNINKLTKTQPSYKHHAYLEHEIFIYFLMYNTVTIYLVRHAATFSSSLLPVCLLILCITQTQCTNCQCPGQNICSNLLILWCSFPRASHPHSHNRAHYLGYHAHAINSILVSFGFFHLARYIHVVAKVLFECC